MLPQASVITGTGSTFVLPADENRKYTILINQLNSEVYLGIGTGVIVTMSGGTNLSGGFVKAGSARLQDFETTLKLGSFISVSTDTLALNVIPITANANVRASMNWKEFV